MGDEVRLCHVCEQGNPQEDEAEGMPSGLHEEATGIESVSSSDEVVNADEIVGMLRVIAEWAELEAEEQDC